MFSSIIRGGLTYHGISVSGRGVFTDGRGKDRETYAGQIKDGLACGLGVLACPGSTIYAEYGPDGKCDGRYLCRGYGLTGYYVFERGAVKERGWTYSASEGDYDRAFCARDDPRLLALIARVAPGVFRHRAAKAPGGAGHYGNGAARAVPTAADGRLGASGEADHPAVGGARGSIRLGIALNAA